MACRPWYVFCLFTGALAESLPPLVGHASYYCRGVLIFIWSGCSWSSVHHSQGTSIRYPVGVTYGISLVFSCVITKTNSYEYFSWNIKATKTIIIFTLNSCNGQHYRQEKSAKTGNDAMAPLGLGSRRNPELRVGRAGHGVASSSLKASSWGANMIRGEPTLAQQVAQDTG